MPTPAALDLVTLYLETGPAPHGLPLIAAFAEFPARWRGDLPPDDGVRPLVSRGGGAVLVERLPLAAYPNVADFVAEAEAVGVRRPVAPTGDLRAFVAGLGRRPSLVVLHDRGWIEDVAPYLEHRPDCVGDGDGPSGDGAYAAELCAAARVVTGPVDGPMLLAAAAEPSLIRRLLWWDDLDPVAGGTPVSPFLAGLVTRSGRHGSKYEGMLRPSHVEARHAPGAIAELPVTRLAIATRGAHDGACVCTHAPPADRARVAEAAREAADALAAALRPHTTLPIAVVHPTRR